MLQAYDVVMLRHNAPQLRQEICHDIIRKFGPQVKDSIFCPEVMPILEKLKEIIDSYGFSDDQGLGLTGWLEERIEELEFILEDELEED